MKHQWRKLKAESPNIGNFLLMYPDELSTNRLRFTAEKGFLLQKTVEK